jgi:prepilin-type N-terminal cleavage/methylation domain-containing protein
MVTCQRKCAFTLVELLVVITIIGILIALLLPAVQAAREAARRMQCQNNMKQVGLAVLNYESQYKTFPPSSCWQSGVSPNDSGQFNNYRANWVIFILPFMDQQSLHDKFDLNAPISGNSSAANMAARAVQIPSMLCPTDPYNRIAFKGSGYATAALGDNWARGNYAANAALGQMTVGTDSVNGALPTSGGWKPATRVA